MSKETSYFKIAEYAKSNDYILITTEREFYTLKEEQGKSGSYVKLTYRCKCGKLLNRDYATLRRSGCRCLDCSRERAANSRRLSLDKQMEMIERRGLTYAEGDIKNHDSKFLVRCGCGNIFETTLRIIKNSERDIIICKSCHGKQMSEERRTPFREIKDFLEAKGCRLVSNEQEYVNCKSQITFIARCGHLHTTSVMVALNNMKHFVCSECQKLLTAGENNYNWKGGYDNEKIKFRKTYEFKQWVKQVYKRDNYTCQCCGARGIRLNAHHLDGYNWSVHKRTDVNNGVTLCESCHNDFHDAYGRGNNTKEQFEEYMQLMIKAS